MAVTAPAIWNDRSAISGYVSDMAIDPAAEQKSRAITEAWVVDKMPARQDI